MLSKLWMITSFCDSVVGLDLVAHNPDILCVPSSLRSDFSQSLVQVSVPCCLSTWWLDVMLESKRRPAVSLSRTFACAWGSFCTMLAVFKVWDAGCRYQYFCLTVYTCWVWRGALTRKGGGAESNFCLILPRFICLWEDVCRMQKSWFDVCSRFIVVLDLM